MPENLFTRSEVIAMTRLSGAKIARYVRQYRHHFTPRAGQPKRGRRYTPQDVQKLLLIRHLKAERKDREVIEAALQDDLLPLYVARYEIDDVTLLIAKAREYMQDVKAQAAYIRRVRDESRWMVNKVRRLEDAINRLTRQVQEIDNRLALYLADRRY